MSSLRPEDASRRSHSQGRSTSFLGSNTLHNRHVVCIKAISSNAKKEDIGEGKLLPGDIVELVVSSDGLELKAPFAGGKSGLQRELRHLYSTGQNLLRVHVKRNGGKVAIIEAFIVPDDSVLLRKQYALKALSDPSHVVVFADDTEDECLTLQEKRHARVVAQLVHTQLTDVNVPYPWHEKMRQVQPVGGFSMVYSMLVLPYAPESAGFPQYNNLEDTMARATTWLSASQAEGIPLTFLSLQTEPLLTKVSGQQGSSRTVSPSSRSDLASIVDSGCYGFEDYHGIDIGVVRAVRLWFAPSFAEIAIEIRVEESETQLGVRIGRTEEGFCYVSTVERGSAADRVGLRDLLDAARTSRKRLVVTRVGDEKVIPWLISSKGSIRGFDTSSISQKLSAHRQAGQPACLRLMAVEGTMHAMTNQESESMATFSSGSDMASSNFFD